GPLRRRRRPCAGQLQWLRDKLPDPVDRTGARRRPVNEALSELSCEGIVNAIVHRDYGIEGAKCQLIATIRFFTDGPRRRTRLGPQVDEASCRGSRAPSAGLLLG